MKKMSKQHNQGFTLVELIVVISIIGILAGIAIPRFMEATKAARGAKIIADMRTIESALNVYYVKYSKYPADKDATGFANIVNSGTWPTPPIGSFTIVHTMSSSGGDPTSGTCDDTTAYTYTYGDSDDIAGSVTLTNASSLSNCADTTSPTVIELLTNDLGVSAYTSSIASLFSTYNSIIDNGIGTIGINFLSTFLSSDADRSVSEEFLETYGISTESNEDLQWYADYNANNDGVILFLTTESNFASNNWEALVAITEDGTVYTSSATYTTASGTYTDYSRITAAVEGDSNSSNNGTGTDIISAEIGVRLEANGFIQQDTLDI